LEVSGTSARRPRGRHIRRANQWQLVGCRTYHGSEAAEREINRGPTLRSHETEQQVEPGSFTLAQMSEATRQAGAGGKSADNRDRHLPRQLNRIPARSCHRSPLIVNLKTCACRTSSSLQSTG